jgi:hypothetical protein
MINILSSDATSPSTAYPEVKRERNENNIQWIRRNLPPFKDKSVLVMLGGRTQIDIRLRFAQAQVRSDLTPSKWSHVMLVKTPADLDTSTVSEISLDPAKGFGFPAIANGLQEAGTLSRYSSTKRYPNVAVIVVPVALADIEKSLTQFRKQRAVLDGVDLIVRWLAYVWGVGRSSNPLLEGFGIPSAAMLEIVIGANGFDVTPGLESRSSCPEAISQAAKYWYEYYDKQKKEGLVGAYWSPHAID